MYQADTIAAISTPSGEGGIGVIRISGPAALAILEHTFKKVSDGGFDSHRFYYGSVIDPASGISMDEALAVFMRSPRSFTREDVVEIQCHSGTIVTQRILGLVLQHGARLAEPGEFTKRAFLNGRVDLLQAESVIDIIRGKTETALTIAERQREGRLSEELMTVRNSLRQALALLEAYVDFPEDEIGETDFSVLAGEVNSASQKTEALLATFAEGKVIRDGVSVLIAGKPNVGKSSLLNALLREKRAIVTAIPGTTRDFIEEVVNIDGLPVKLLDTAGIRNTDDPIEREGVRLALDRISSADLVLFLVDTSRPFDDDDQMVATALAAANFLLVKNKADLVSRIELPSGLQAAESVSISTQDGSGLTPLKSKIAEIFLHGKAVDSRDAVIICNVRHRDLLAKVAQLLAGIQAALATASAELLAVDLREALHLLGQITGETTTDDILDLIFSQFCVGK